MTNSMYYLGLDQTANLIKAIGHKRTVLAQGHMGTGKSSLLKMLAEMLPTHTPVYFDCTTKDLGDLMLPRIAEVDAETPYVSYAPNEELGIHHNTPVIVMLDEYGKANPAVKQGLTAFMLERRLGNNALHPDSIVFCTTNLGAEGVGDLLVAHQRNRIIPVTVRKPSNVDWIEWGTTTGSTTACWAGAVITRSCSLTSPRSKTLTRTPTSSTHVRSVLPSSLLVRSNARLTSSRRVSFLTTRRWWLA